jgi:hypothetical protein
MALVNAPDDKGDSESGALLRVKGLLALSGLLRHYQAALQAAHSAGLAPRLVALCADPDVRVKR